MALEPSNGTASQRAAYASSGVLARLGATAEHLSMPGFCTRVRKVHGFFALFKLPQFSACTWRAHVCIILVRFINKS